MRVAAPVRVLLVEDNEADTTLVSHALSAAAPPGYRLTSVGRLSEALASLKASPPQIVILDLQLPDSEGLDTLCRVLGAAPGIPIVILSGRMDDELAARAVHEGAEDYFVKDPDLREWIGRDVRRSLERHGARLRSELRDHESRFRSVFESPMVGILFRDFQGRIFDANRTFLGMVGRDPEEVAAGRLLWSELTLPGQGEADARVLEEVRTRGSSAPFNQILVRKDGSRFPALLSVSRLAGWADRCVYFALDVSREKALEEQFLQAQKMEAVGRLAGGVAHDFNNILTAINGYGELIRARLDPADPVRGDIEEVLKAGERAAALTRQLLAFGRRQILEPKVLDLNAVLADMDGLLRRVIGEDIDMVTSLQENLGRVKVDPTQIQQVVMNLAVNARDAMPKGGKLTLETADAELTPEYCATRHDVKPGRHVMLAVSDDGVGMDPATRARLFEPFFTTKEKGKGTGLGLSTVYGIVRQSGGYVWVYSEPGHGSTFKIYLPRVEEALDLPPAPAVSAASLRGTETILVVEDDPTVRQLTCHVLQSHGYRVLVAADGAEALAVCAERGDSIDLLITDVVLPRMGGKALVEVVRPLLPRLKILFVSGYTENAIVHHGVLDPGVPFLPKPYAPRGLLERVRALLG